MIFHFYDVDEPGEGNMDKMKSLYNRAVNKVQSKIIEDIDRYFERLDDLPTLDQYYNDRNNFLQQIWQNIWVNVVQGAYSIKERK